MPEGIGTVSVEKEVGRSALTAEWAVSGPVGGGGGPAGTELSGDALVPLFGERHFLHAQLSLAYEGLRAPTEEEQSLCVSSKLLWRHGLGKKSWIEAGPAVSYFAGWSRAFDEGSWTPSFDQGVKVGVHLGVRWKGFRAEYRPVVDLNRGGVSHRASATVGLGWELGDGVSLSLSSGIAFDSRHGGLRPKAGLAISFAAEGGAAFSLGLFLGAPSFGGIDW